jgi:hypothetical protein
MNMKAVVDSLSFGSSAGLVAVCSAVSAWLLCYVRPAIVRWVGALSIPLLLACCLYWAPVWCFRENPLEYHFWEPLYIMAWFLAGAVPATTVAAVFGILARQKKGPS